VRVHAHCRRVARAVADPWPSAESAWAGLSFEQWLQVAFVDTWYTWQSFAGMAPVPSWLPPPAAAHAAAAAAAVWAWNSAAAVWGVAPAVPPGTNPALDVADRPRAAPAPRKRRRRGGPGGAPPPLSPGPAAVRALLLDDRARAQTQAWSLLASPLLAARDAAALWRAAVGLPVGSGEAPPTVPAPPA
jgi:hypothetical protein